MVKYDSYDTFSGNVDHIIVIYLQSLIMDGDEDRDFTY